MLNVRHSYNSKIAAFQSIRTRLIIILLPVFLLSILTIALVSYRQSVQTFDELGIERLKQAADMAYILCEEQEKIHLQGRQTREEAQERVREALIGPIRSGARDLSSVGVRIGNDDYFFAINSKGAAVMHPHLALNTDVSDKAFIQQFIKQQNGVVQYKWRNKGDLNEREKIAFVRTFGPWDWIIGIGDYMDNFTAPAAVQLRQTLSLLVIFSIGLVGLLLLLGILITRPLLLLQNQVAKFDSEHPVEIEGLKATGEVGALVVAFNRMIAGIRERNFIKDTFGRYVSKQVQEAILNKEIPLEGELKKATILFTDIREFTGLSEQLGPEGTIRFLNEYFSRMVDVILAREGSIDKFIGDAIMAVFGAPISQEDDAYRAVEAAIDLVAALDGFNRERALAGLAETRIGIGVHTGAVIAGNIGTPQRMEYTVVGDTVNLASRIQSLTPYYQIPIIITDSTFREIQDEPIRTREIDSVRVKGRRRPVVIYEVYEHFSPDRKAAMDQLKPVFLQALSFYKMRRFGKARRTFEDGLAISPGDHLTTIYLDRCRNYLESPPDEDWDGVFM